MILQHILTVAFILMMGANIVAFVRHWRMMRALEISLNAMVESQKEFDEVMRQEQLRKHPQPPDY